VCVWGGEAVPQLDQLGSPMGWGIGPYGAMTLQFLGKSHLQAQQDGWHMHATMLTVHCLQGRKEVPQRAAPSPPPFHPGSALTVAQRTLLAAQGVQQCALSWLLAMPSLQRCQAHLC
jgi:hypothetical protein